MDNYIACLLGGAIGDALGAPVEFDSIALIREKYGPHGVTGYVEYADDTGEFTDDTQMTLFTAEGLLRAWHRAHLKGIGGATTHIVHESYLRWLHTQGERPDYGQKNKALDYAQNGWLIQQQALFKRRAPGNSCLSALKSGKAGTISTPINDSKGCGGIMRMAPVGLIFKGNPEKSFTTGCDLAAITHGHPTGYLSAGFFASLISDLAVATPFEKALQNALQILRLWPNHHETLMVVENAINLYELSKADLLANPKLLPQHIEKLGKGWVAEEALAISLYCCLLYPTDFPKGVLAAVNHSGDSDSTGSIAGNLLGLMNGLQSLPQPWINQLRHHPIVIAIAKDLHTGIKGNTYEPDNEWWEKYPGY